MPGKNELIHIYQYLISKGYHLRELYAISPKEVINKLSDLGLLDMNEIFNKAKN